MATTQSSRSSRSAPQSWLSQITKKVAKRPALLVIMGKPGVGKPSLALNIPGVVCIQFTQEQSIGALKATGAVPEDAAVFPCPSNWTELLAMLDALATGEHDYKCLAIDTVSCAERMMHEHVCARDYNGEWERGFLAYARGFEASLADFRGGFLKAVDRLRDERKMSVVMLEHTQVRPYKNPMGEDYDRFVPALHAKTWDLLHRSADAVLMADYYTQVDESGNRPKGKGGKTRILHTAASPAVDCKNRYHMPEVVEMGDSGEEAWANLLEAMKGGK